MKTIPTAYTTKDGSRIKELLHPNQVPLLQNQSLAEATIGPGDTTKRHHHILSEEIYYILQGEGFLYLGDETRLMKRGDVAVIPPSTPHHIYNSGRDDLKILCCCAPAYSHEDTVIVEE